MQLKIRKIGNGFGVLFPKQMLEDLNLSEDSTPECFQGRWRLPAGSL